MNFYNRKFIFNMVVFVLHSTFLYPSKLCAMNLSFIDAKGLEFLFASSDRRDLNLANDILEEKHTDADYKDELINYLNTKYSDWHFFMRNCRIEKIKAHKTD